jgi:nicastrin
MAPLYPIEKEEDWEIFKKKNKKSKYSLVLPENVVIKSNLEELQDQIGGLFIYSTFSNNISFASTSPQGKNSPDGNLNPFSNKEIKWNPNGTSLMENSFPFPIFLLKDEQITKEFVQRALKNQQKNHKPPEFKAFMNYYFGPKEMNSIKCLSNKNIYGKKNPKCDPLGGQSVWGWRGNQTSTEIVMISTNMDAIGFSPYVFSPGANMAASNVVTLLVAANALQKIPDKNFKKKIVFSFFQSEKFGFVGSRKFLFDLKKWSSSSSSSSTTTLCEKKISNSNSPFGSEFCTKPLVPSLAFTKIIQDIDNIQYLLGIDQVGLLPLGANSTFKLHFNPNAPQDTMLLNAFIKAPSSFKTNSSSWVSPSSRKDVLPPNSILSFLNEKEFGRKNLSTGILTGFDTTFIGEGLYGSRHDIVENLDIDTLTKAAQILAEAIYTLSIQNNSSNDEFKKIKVNTTLVKEMVTCFSSNWRCDLMNTFSIPFVETQKKNNIFLSKNYWPKYMQPATLYTGTYDHFRQSVVLTNVGIKDKPTEELTEFDDDWSDETTKLRLLPNAYEVFIQAFLSSSMVDLTTLSSLKECLITQDCEKDEECVVLMENSNNTNNSSSGSGSSSSSSSSSSSKSSSVCTIRQAFFHDAISPGLKRTKTIGIYEILDETMPLWTEPIWQNDIGSFIFPDPGLLISWLVFATGLFLTIISLYLSQFVLHGVEKLKLL